ncbi:MAG: TIM44-like domain-containing protein [Methylobacteriaceae bacterium]|nr:TIM44-like domain-containing protein [Methylobacteriaceae bacterium]
MKALAVASALMLVAANVAEARTGAGRNSGSRGSNTNSPPPITNTAPRQAQPLPGPGMNAPRPGMPNTPAAQPNRWGGFLGGLGAGLLGAGLMGMMFGGGFMNGIGSFMGFLGFILQMALIAGLVMFAISWFRRRNQPAMAAAAPGSFQRNAAPGWPQAGPAAGGMFGASAAAPQPAPVQTQPLEVQPADYDRFEAMLGEVQASYSAADRVALTRLVAPELANDLNAELDEMARRGVVNKLSGVKLLQGDLSEAWSEPGADYATVAMRYAIVDATIDRATGRVLDGDEKTPQQVTELWTFRREPGAGPQGWALSAIQQAA